jgi:hypothetical protein
MHLSRTKTRCACPEPTHYELNKSTLLALSFRFFSEVGTRQEARYSGLATFSGSASSPERSIFHRPRQEANAFVFLAFRFDRARPIAALLYQRFSANSMLLLKLPIIYI